jgi:hypothetical protein
MEHNRQLLATSRMSGTNELSKHKANSSRKTEKSKKKKEKNGKRVPLVSS